MQRLVNTRQQCAGSGGGEGGDGEVVREKESKKAGGADGRGSSGRVRRRQEVVVGVREL
jgi:hypothetical protein